MSTCNPLTAPHCFFKRKSLQEPEISVPIFIVTINAFFSIIWGVLSLFIFSPGFYSQSFVVTLLLKNNYPFNCKEKNPLSNISPNLKPQITYNPTSGQVHRNPLPIALQTTQQQNVVSFRVQFL